MGAPLPRALGCREAKRIEPIMGLSRFRTAILLLAGGATSGCFAHTPAIPGPGRPPPPASVAALDEVGLYEMDQGVLWALNRSQQEPAPAQAEDEAPTADRIILPFLFYTPETKLAAGVVATGYRRLEPDLPPSSLLGAVTVTARRQVSFEVTSELHRPDGGRIDAEARFSHFPDRFFGVGPGTPDEAEEAYTSRTAQLELRLQRQVRSGFRVGPQATFHWEDVVEAEEEGLLAEGNLTGADGGRWFGVGALSTYDTRDHVLQPRRGTYFEASALWFPGGLGTTAYHRGVLDARRFVPLGDRSTLAYRAYVEGSAGDVPVLLLPFLGGRERLRGYYEGRLRDRFVGSVQAEARFPLWWRLDGVAFGEAGQVAPRLGKLLSGRAELSAGAGLRYRVSDDGARIRLDFAVGRRGSGLYLTIGEAF